jgi:hypothetical protein
MEIYTILRATFQIRSYSAIAVEMTCMKRTLNTPSNDLLGVLVVCVAVAVVIALIVATQIMLSGWAWVLSLMVLAMLLGHILDSVVTQLHSLNQEDLKRIAGDVVLVTSLAATCWFITQYEALVGVLATILLVAIGGGIWIFSRARRV